MIMPDNTIAPNIATKPNGILKISNATLTPMNPKGAVNMTKNTREKLLS